MESRLSMIGRQFNRSAAASYDKHAHVQRVMADWLVTSLVKRKRENASDRLDILEIGCGTGLLTELLVRNYPCSSITALDIAPAMLDAAEQRIIANTEATVERDAVRQFLEVESFSIPNNYRPHVRFLQADIEMWAANAPSSSFDLIVSSACFQWLNRPKETLFYLRRLLRSGGLLVFTTFGHETFRELHEAFDEVYRVQGMVPQRHGLTLRSKDDWEALLLEGGFSKVQDEQSVQVQCYASVRDFLLSVKGVGASTSEAETSHGLSRRLLTNMFKNYQDKFSIPGGIAVTYDLLLLQAVAY